MHSPAAPRGHVCAQPGAGAPSRAPLAFGADHSLVGPCWALQDPAPPWALPTDAWSPSCDNQKCLPTLPHVPRQGAEPPSAEHLGPQYPLHNPVQQTCLRVTVHTASTSPPTCLDAGCPREARCHPGLGTSSPSPGCWHRAQAGAPGRAWAGGGGRLAFTVWLLAHGRGKHGSNLQLIKCPSLMSFFN